MVRLQQLQGLFKSGNIRDEDFAIGVLELAGEQGVETVFPKLSDTQLSVVENWVCQLNPKELFLISGNWTSLDSKAQEDRVRSAISAALDWFRK